MSDYTFKERKKKSLKTIHAFKSNQIFVSPFSEKDYEIEKCQKMRYLYNCLRGIVQRELMIINRGKNVVSIDKSSYNTVQYLKFSNE